MLKAIDPADSVAVRGGVAKAVELVNGTTAFRFGGPSGEDGRSGIAWLASIESGSQQARSLAPARSRALRLTSDVAAGRAGRPS